MSLSLEYFKTVLPVEPRPDLEGIMHHSFLLEDPKFFYDGTLHQLGFNYVDGFLCEPLLMVWLHIKERLILSYCEGDLYLYESPNLGDWMEHARAAVDCLHDQFEGSALVEGLTVI